MKNSMKLVSWPALHRESNKYISVINIFFDIEKNNVIVNWKVHTYI
jgi:hypothetical protein